MTPEQQLYRELWLAELWRPVRELPREERAAIGTCSPSAQLPAVGPDRWVEGEAH